MTSINKTLSQYLMNGGSQFPMQHDIMAQVCRLYCKLLNPLIIITLNPQSNGSLYSNTVIGTLAIDGWVVTFGTARRGVDGLWPHPVPSSLYQM